MKDKIRLGVIGCGYISDLTVCGYVNNPNVIIKKVCDTDVKKAEKKARKWNAVEVCKDYREVLEDPEIDAVEIITPHHLHKSMVIESAECGKHISVQKPMAMNVTEVDEMIESAKKAGVKLRVFEAYVFYPAIVRARQIIESGEIGQPTAVRIVTNGVMPPEGYNRELMSSYVWRFDMKKVGGGTLFDDMHHKYATLMYLVGDVEEIFAIIHNRDKFIDTPAVAIWQYAGLNPPCLGTLTLTFSPEFIVASPTYSVDERFEVIGTKGILWITRCTSEVFHLPALIVQTTGRRVSHTDLEVGWEAGFRRAGEHFVECILKDKTPEYSPYQARKVIQLAHAIYKSDEEKRLVKPAEITA